MHWAVDYIGREWVSGAQGPDTFDCWGFLRYVQRERFGINIPVVDLDDVDPRIALRAFNGNRQWLRVSSPQEGDCVRLSYSTDPHVGVWIDADGGGLLHCVEHTGVIFNNLSALRLNGWKRIKYYRYSRDMKYTR